MAKSLSTVTSAILEGMRGLLLIDENKNLLSVPDDSAFTAGTNSVMPMGGVYQSTVDTLDANDVGVPRITDRRSQIVAVDSEAVSTTLTWAAESSAKAYQFTPPIWARSMEIYAYNTADQAMDVQIDTVPLAGSVFGLFQGFTVVYQADDDLATTWPGSRKQYAGPSAAAGASGYVSVPWLGNFVSPLNYAVRLRIAPAASATGDVQIAALYSS